MVEKDPEAIRLQAEALFRDWTRPAASVHGPSLQGCVSEPAPIALRARWHFLRASGPSEELRCHHRVSLEQWQREIELESDGDVALVRQQIGRARERFSELLEIASHPVVEVQALIGLGDAHRQSDDIEPARARYEEAAALADQVGFAFGAMRARLPLAYLVRRSGSAEPMLEIAEQCEQSARSLGDDIYVANARIAQGEALDLLGRSVEAVSVLTLALDHFVAHGNKVGIAGAGVRLIDVHRRREDAEAMLAVWPTVMGAARAIGAIQEMVDLCDLVAFAFLKRAQYQQALDACDEGIRFAESTYPRAIAHLQMSKGTVLREWNRPDEAIDPLLAALAYFDGRDTDGSTVSSCLALLASCAERLGDLGEAVELRLRSIDRLEVVRAGQVKPLWQNEMRRRFDDLYRGALECVVRADDPAAFAVIFESLWGRRLIGVRAGVALDPDQDPLLLAQLIALNDQAKRKGPPQDPDPGQRRLRRLGRFAVGAALPDQYDEATAAALAAAYRPIGRDEPAALLAESDPDVALLLICEVPNRPGAIAWLTRTPGERARVGQMSLTADVMTVLDTWTSFWPRAGTAADVAPLGELIPAPLRDLPAGSRLQIVALDRLWGVPWTAIPVLGQVLGTRYCLMSSPSLSLLSGRQGRVPAAVPEQAKVVAAIGPEVAAQNLAGLRTSSRPGPEAGRAALAAICSGSADAVVVVAHGRPTPGIGHYLELGQEVLLTPTEMLSATPPPVMALLCCWGARTTGLSTGEPLTLATVAMARGTQQILTSVSELGDSVLATSIVNDVLYEAREHPWAIALQRVLGRRYEEVQSEPLINWAALTTLGAW